MTNSQTQLTSLFLEGKVPGESGTPKHIETVISNVFLFSERVYKLYKNDNVFFNKHFRDIADRATRMAFSKSDFEWNHRLSPDVYLELKAVRAGSGTVEFVENKEHADEYISVTKRLPEDASFFSILHSQQLSSEDFVSIGTQFATREALATPSEVPVETFAENIMGRVGDVEGWVSEGAMDGWVSKTELHHWLQFLESSAEVLIKNEDTQPLALCFDIHSLNAFYYEGVCIPFDTSPPKESWRFGPSPINAYRLATDILVFAGEPAYTSFLEGYRSASGRPPLQPRDEKMWITYASLIMTQYLFFLGKADPDKLSAARAYRDFLRRIHPPVSE